MKRFTLAVFSLSLFIQTASANSLNSEQIYSVELVKTKMVPILVKKATCRPEDIAKTLGEIYNTIQKFVTHKTIPIMGAPFSRYFKYSPSVVEFEAGFPAITAQHLEEGIIQSYLPEGSAAMTIHKGPYEQIGPAYEAIHAWVKVNHFTTNGAPWEVYVNDPSLVKPEEILTHIYYPVKK